MGPWSSVFRWLAICCSDDEQSNICSWERGPQVSSTSRGKVLGLLALCVTRSKVWNTSLPHAVKPKEVMFSWAGWEMCFLSLLEVRAALGGFFGYQVQHDNLPAVRFGTVLEMKFGSACKLFCSRGAASPHHCGPWLSRTGDVDKWQLNGSSALKLPLWLLCAQQCFPPGQPHCCVSATCCM